MLLESGAPLSIHVTAPNGLPVAGARVRLYPKTLRGPRDVAGLQAARFRAEHVAAVGTTDEAGDATWAHGVVADSYVVVDALGFAPCAGTVTAEEVASGVSSFRLTPAAPVVVRVIDGASSRPIAGVSLFVGWNPAAEKVEGDGPEATLRALGGQSGVTDAEGRARIDGVPAGESHAMWLAAEGYPSRKTLPVATSEVEQLVRLFGGASRKGRVVDEEGEPVEGVLVTAAVCGVWPSQEVCRTRTLADGTFDAEALPDSPLVFMLRKDGYGLGIEVVHEAVGGDLDDFVLHPEERCSGIVRDDRGTPLPGARLDFFLIDTGSHAGYFETYDDGTFDMPWIGRDAELIVLAAAKGHGPRRMRGVRPGSGHEIVLERDGSLVGEVLGSDGSPVPSFRIAWRSCRRQVEYETVGHDALPWQEIRSPDGSFEVRGVPAGPIDLWIDARGRERPEPRRVVVPPGGAPEPLRIELAVARTIAGRVVRPDGSAVGGASVSWLLESSLGEPLGRETPTQATTDNDGRFVLSGLPERSFALRVTDNVHPNATYPELRADEFPRELVYAATSRIEGRIAVPWSAPETAVSLFAQIEGTQTPSSVDIAPDGSYVFGPAPAGRWILELRDDWGMRFSRGYTCYARRVVDVRPGETVRADFDMRGGGVVRGRVIAPLDEDEYRTVQLFLERERAPGDGAEAGVAAHGLCDSDGSFALFGLASGRYRVQAVSCLRGYGAAAEEDVELRDGDAEADVTLRLGEARLRGRVVDPEGRPLSADVHVERDADGVRLFTARSDLDGSYALVPPAREHFRLVVSAPGHAIERSDTLDPDRLDGGEREHVLELEARLHVTVRDDAGAPIASARVEVEEAAHGGCMAGVLRVVATTDLRGGATATRLPAGTFRVHASHPDWPVAKPVFADVEWGESREVELRLTRHGRLRVLVTGADGLPRAGVAVTLERAGDPAASREAPTGDDGTLLADALAAGRWSASTAGAEPVTVEVPAGGEAEATLVVQ